jgi:hypothetical protein
MLEYPLQNVQFSLQLAVWFGLVKTFCGTVHTVHYIRYVP